MFTRYISISLKIITLWLDMTPQKTRCLDNYRFQLHFLTIGIQLKNKHKILCFTMLGPNTRLGSTLASPANFLTTIRAAEHVIEARNIAHVFTLCGRGMSCPQIMQSNLYAPPSRGQLSVSIPHPTPGNRV